MENKEILTKNPEETRFAAGEFIREVLKEKGGNGAVLICLRGDLGAGKTTFVQGIGQALGVRETLNSPTFLIMKKCPLSGGYAGKCLYHFDTYRISAAEDIMDLGWEEIISGRHNIVVVEWPEKISSILPKRKIDIDFRHISENERRIIFSS